MIRPRVDRRPRLLLVDDCIAERDLYECVLARDYDIQTAARGDEGLHLALRDHPDAIVLDVIMPGIDGWETCRALKTHPATADIPVILLTGADDHDLPLHARRVGAETVLTKPCPGDRLSATIERALSPRRKAVWS